MNLKPKKKETEKLTAGIRLFVGLFKYRKSWYVDVILWYLLW